MIKLRKIYLSLLIIPVLIIGLSCNKENQRRVDAYDSFNQGVRAVKADNLDLAGYYFRRAVILNPDFTDAKMNLANVHFLRGNLDKAREEYTSILDHKNQDPRVMFNLGWIYLSQKDYDTARDCFLKCQKMDQSFTDPLYGLALLAKAQDENALAKFYLENYLKQDSYGRWAKKAGEELAEIAPDDLAIAKLPETSDETVPEIVDESDETTPPEEPQATSVDEEPVEIKKPVIVKPVEPEKKPEPVIKKEEKEKKEPVKTEIQVKSVKDLLKEGYSALEKGDYKTAENRFKQAYTQDKASGESAKALAKYYLRKRNETEEKKYLQDMMKRRGENPSNLYQFAQAYEKIGDINSAIESYRNYLVKNPFGPDAEKAKKRLTELDKSKGTGK